VAVRESGVDDVFVELAKTLVRQNREEAALGHLVEHVAKVDAYEVLEFIDVKMVRRRIVAELILRAAFGGLKEFVDQERAEHPGVLSGKVIGFGKIHEQYLAFLNNFPNVYGTLGETHEAGEHG